MLNSDPTFDGTQSANGKPVPIVTEQIGDVISYTQKAIGEMGLVVVILTPDFSLLNKDYAPLVSWVRIQIQVSEFYAINQSSTGIGISAQTLTTRIVELLHWKPHKVIPGISDRAQIIELVGVTLKAHTDQRSALTYLLIFRTQLLIKTL